MAHISYKELIRSRMPVVNKERLLGALLTLSFHKDTGYAHSLMYYSKGKKHMLRAVHLLMNDRGIDVDFEAEERKGEIWRPREQRVYTQMGIYLGKIRDVYIDDTLMKLSYLDVRRTCFFITIRSYRISRDEIMRLGDRKVIVKDTSVKQGGGMVQTTLQSRVPIMEMIQDNAFEE